ncbi:MAG: FG-GAP-like repeat-containing protein [Verrucomicrobiota bacterium]
MKTTCPFIRILCLFAALSVICHPLTNALAQGTPFTYQGRLNDASGPVTGLFNFQFGLYDDALSGSPQGTGTVVCTNTPVTNGLFTVTLDFGWGVFDGNARWLELAVQPAGGTNFTTLAPRQALMPAPMAQYAAKAGSASTANVANQATFTMNAMNASHANSAYSASTVPASGITGTLDPLQLPAGLLTNGAVGVNLAGSFAGDGSGLSNVTVAASAVAGTLSLAQLPGPVLTNNAGGVNLYGAFTGNGTGMTNVDLRSVNAFGAVAWGGSGPISFSVGSTPGVGDTPQSVVAADVNGDGRPDLIAAAYFGGLLTVLTNSGGGFALSATYVLGANPTAVATADLNHDGKPDLISANGLTNTLTVLTNNGAGGFVIAFSLPVGSSPNGVLAADVNGDGWADLISANTGDNTLTVLTNNTRGGFATAATLATGNYPRAVAAVEVNGDGRLALVSVNRLGNSLTLFPNSGNGQFGAGVTLAVGHQPFAVTSADVNHDGKPDIISANTAEGTLTVLTNNGAGGFSPAATLPVGRAPLAVAAADLNWDGKVDLISVNNYDNDVMVLTNDGHGGFAMAGTNAVGQSPWGLALADWNGDGRMDLATAAPLDGNVSVLLNTTSWPQANFSGNGANLTSLNAGNLAAGTVSDQRLSANVALLNANQTFAGLNQFAGPLIATNPANLIGGTISASSAVITGYLSASAADINGTITAGSFAGNGAGLTNLPGSLVWQTIAGTNVQMVNNAGYLLTSTQQVSLLLPTNSRMSDILRVTGAGGGGWQILNFLSLITTTNFSTSGYHWTNYPSDAFASFAPSANGTHLVAAFTGKPYAYYPAAFSGNNDDPGVGGHLSLSFDSGATWTQCLSNFNNFVSVASSADGTHLVAVSKVGTQVVDYVIQFTSGISYWGGEIWISTNSGATWTNRTPHAGDWTCVASSADGTRLVAVGCGSVDFRAAHDGTDIYNDGNSIWVSADSGATWTAQSHISLWQAVASSADGSRLIAADDYSIWLSSDYGVTWSQTCTNQAYAVDSLASSADGTRYVAGTADGWILLSANSGATWKPQTIDSSGNPVYVSSSSDGMALLAATRGGSIYYSTNAGLFWIAQSETADRPWTAVGLSANGIKRFATADSFYSAIYNSIAQPLVVTRTNISVFASGASNAAVELQYVGKGKFIPISDKGTVTYH